MDERRPGGMSADSRDAADRRAGSRNSGEKVCIKAPYIDQSGTYPTGCESVSAVMLLQFLGVGISVDEFIEKYLDKQGFEERDGVLYGPDPRKYFCGSPYDADSFGCYAPVVAKALRRALGSGYTVTDETGARLEELARRYLDRGMPVVCWACINMREPIIGPQWKLLDTGETFTWISNEHCMLLVGYDEEGYYFNDPYDNNGLIRYPKETVEERHRAQHMQAVGVWKNGK